MSEIPLSSRDREIDLLYLLELRHEPQVTQVPSGFAKTDQVASQLFSELTRELVEIQILPIPDLFHAAHVQSLSIPERVLCQKLVHIER